MQVKDINRKIICGLWWALLFRTPDPTKQPSHPHAKVDGTTLARSYLRDLPQKDILELYPPTVELVASLIGTYGEELCYKWYNLFREEVCKKCPYYELEDQWVGSSYTNKDRPRLIVVGQAPGTDEVDDGRPFVGPAGKYLWKRLGEINVVRSSIYVTNSVKCRPPKDAEPTAEALACCTPLLYEELKQLPDLLVIATGKVAVRAITHLKAFRIDDYAGGCVDSQITHHTVFVLKHPASVLRSESLWIDRQYRDHVSQLQRALSGEKFKHTLPSFEVVDSPTKFDEFELKVRQQPICAIDIETTGFGLEDEIVSIAISNDLGTWAFPILTHPYLVDKLRQVLPALKLIAHNAIFDICMINYKWDLECDAYWDTMQFQHLLDEEGELSLDILAVRMVGAPPGFKEKGDRFWRIKDLVTHLKEHKEDLITFLEYNATDAYYTYKIYLAQQKHPEYVHVINFYNIFTNPVLNMFIDTNKFGVPIDVHQMIELNKHFSTEISNLEQELFAIVGSSFRYRSTQELANVLRLLGVTEEQTGKTDTGRMKLTHDVIEKLSEAENEKVARLAQKILEIRKLEKLRDTYIRQLSKYIYTNVYTKVPSVSPVFKLHSSKTYRINTENPNIHNIPRGSQLKKLFAAPEGYVILGSDYESAEAFHAASISGESKIIEFVLDPTKNQHRYTAASVFGIPEDQVTKDQREIAKLVWFCLQYGGTEYAVARDLNISYEEATKIVNGIRKTYPRLFHTLDSFVAVAKANKRLVNRFGAVKRFKIWEGAFASANARQALNFPMQSEVSTYCHLATHDLHLIMKEVGLKNWRVLFTIHDAIYTLVKKELVSLAAAIMKKVMELPRCGMYLLTSPEVGPTWYDLHPLEGTEEELYNSFLAQPLDELIRRIILNVERDTSNELRVSHYV